uniref:DUF4283 domain-containing protein n=1 Tax=Populus davidiana TaxID=266767 RepID=A0A6M2F509_9ROSI
MQRSPTTIQLPPSLDPYRRDKAFSDSTESRHSSNAHLVGSGSLSSHLGAENPSPDASASSSLPPDSGCGLFPDADSYSSIRSSRVPTSAGVAALPSSADARAAPGNPRRATTGCPPGAPCTQSPSLVHFPDYNFMTSYQLMETNLGDHKNLWTFCFIGYVAGKFPGFTALTKFIDSSWKCKANLTMHDTDWLIYSFSSETDMLAVLSDDPYFVFGRPLILNKLCQNILILQLLTW